MLKQLDRDIKCLETFSESTLISANAVVYRPKSTQPIHRKSYSFNSPHLMTGMLRHINRKLQANNAD